MEDKQIINDILQAIKLEKDCVTKSSHQWRHAWIFRGDAYALGKLTSCEDEYLFLERLEKIIKAKL